MDDRIFMDEFQLYYGLFFPIDFMSRLAHSKAINVLSTVAFIVVIASLFFKRLMEKHFDALAIKIENASSCHAIMIFHCMV